MIARAAAVAAAIATVLAAAGAAHANGLDLSDYEGKPGDEVAFSGHTWMTCCPPQPYNSVRLRLVKPNRDRVDLVEADVDEFGSVFATFEVPDVPPGTYEIEPCGASEATVPGSEDCRLTAGFSVLAGRVGGGGSAAGTIAVAVVLPLVVIGTGAALWLLRRRRPS